MISATALAARIDHTLLRPEASAEQVRRLCDEARTYHFAAVCVQPVRVVLAIEALQGTDILVCTVVGFPHGSSLPEIKVHEAACALALGAKEVDMVVNLGAVADADWETLGNEIHAVAETVHSGQGTLKVILECGLFSQEQNRKAARIAVESGADFLKTSTGFQGGGATVADVRLLREVAGTMCKVKAAGGIRDLPTALAMLDAGADRLGCSASVALMQQALESAKPLPRSLSWGD